MPTRAHKVVITGDGEVYSVYIKKWGRAVLDSDSRLPVG